MHRYPAVITVVAAGAIAFLAASVTPGPKAAPHRQSAPVAGRAVAAQPAIQPVAAATSGPDLSPMMAMAAPLATVGHNVTMTTTGSTLVGAVDPADHEASAIAKGSGLELDEIVDNGQIFMKANLGTDLDQQAGIAPDVWMKVDPSQIATDNELLIQPDASDPVDLTGIMTGITKLQPATGGNLVGMIDLTKITGHTQPDADELTQAGTAATHVPITVAADPNGRISIFRVYADTFDPALTLRVDYSGYGEPSAISVPTNAVPAPTGLYGLINN